MRSRVDDPDHSITALQFSLARELPVHVNGTELRALGEEVEEALTQLAALPDDEALNDLVGATCALLAVQEFLQKLAAKFDAAGGGP